MKKYCPQCKADVRKADYYRHPKTADGLMPICKSCHMASAQHTEVSAAGTSRITSESASA